MSSGRRDWLAPEILGMLLATALVGGVGSGLNILLGLVLGEGAAALAAGPGWLGGAFLAGLFLNGPIGILFRFANFWTVNVGVNAVFYVTMPLSLVWLWLFRETPVAWPGVLFLGAGLVLAAKAAIGRCGRERPAAGESSV